jgi:hypothetical protein
MTLKRIAWVTVLFCLSLSNALAQFGSAVQGIVTDPTGSAIPDAVVHVTDLATGVAREATTANDGLYRVINLGLGTYRVNIAVPGFAPEERPSVHVDLNQTVRVDFVLQIGNLVNQITVSEQAALVETEVGHISGALEPVKINELPMNGKNLLTLLAFEPGVTGISLAPTFRAAASAQADTFAGETLPTINANGSRTQENTFTLDDSNIMSPPGNGTNLVPNADSIEEVRVTANNFSADQGRGAAARVQMISKAGSNAFHGGASEYFQNNTLSDRNVFEGKLSAFRRNQFASNVGGRIFRDRTFFFTSYEGLRMSGGRASIVTVLTPAFENWVAQALPNGIAAQVLKVSPASVIPTSSFVLASSIAAPAGLPPVPAGLEAYGAASFVPPAWRTGNQESIRIDHELRPGKDKVFGNYYHTNANNLVPVVYTAFTHQYDVKTTFLSLNETHIVSPSQVNEFKFGMMRFEGWQTDSADPQIPVINVTPISAIGINYQPSHWEQYSFNFSEMFSWVHGSHSFKVGGEFRRVPQDILSSGYIPAYSFTNVLNFAADNPYLETRFVNPSTGLPMVNNSLERRHEMAAFIQDDWKPFANLTFNLGLRWEDFPPATEGRGHNVSLILGPGTGLPQELAGAVAEFVHYSAPNHNHDFGPRFGLAWNPDGHGTTAIRAGFGIVYDRPNHAFASIEDADSPYQATVTMGSQYGTSFIYSLGNPTQPYLGYPVDAALKAGINQYGGINGLRVAEKTIDPTFTNAYVESWMFGFQRQVSKGWTAELDYSGSAGHHLYSLVNINSFPGDLLNGGVFHGFNPAFSTILWYQSVSNSIYNGVTASIKRTFTKGFMFEAYGNFGKVLDTEDVDNSATSYQDVWNRAAERGPASFDVSQRLALVSVWQIPFFKGQKGPEGKVLGGWQIALTGIMQTGQPVTVTSSAIFPTGDWNADGTTSDVRPNAPAPSVQRSDFTRQQYITGMFPASVFPHPTLGTDGNLGRNVFRGPGFIEPDLSLSKTFALTEKVALHVKMDAYNVINRVNLLQPTMDMASSSFGKSTDQLTPRSFQAYVKLTF